MRTRKELICELIKNPKISTECLLELSAYGWDSDIELARLNISDILSVLHSFTSGQLSAQEVEDWANRIEGRDDIDYTSEVSVGEAIFLLANPSINTPISTELCSHIEKLLCNTHNIAGCT